MFTRDDLIDAILDALARKDGGSGRRPAVHRPETGPKGRPFLTEHQIKKALTPGAQQLTIPEDAIISPLALEWLELKGIRVVRAWPSPELS